MAQTISGGISIDFEDIARNEPTLLFLPGWCESRIVFEHVAPQCATSHRVISLDWRGHGRSGPASGDFGTDELVADALAVIEATKPEQIVPVTVSHAGWVAIELRRRLGARVAKLVLLDWLMTDPPPAFSETLRGLQDRSSVEKTRDQLFTTWTAGSDNEEVLDHLRSDMGGVAPEMWARAARSIQGAYAAHGNPMRALEKLRPPVRTLHLYSQPKNEDYRAVQDAFAADNSWFEVRRLDAVSHFPTLETPDKVASAILEFLAE